MVATYVRKTVGDKLEAYLLPAAKGSEMSDRLPPLFVRMERHFRRSITSYCDYYFFDDRGRRFDVLFKSNVFNIEIAFTLHLATPPLGLEGSSYPLSFASDPPGDGWDAAGKPLTALVRHTIYGSLAEGYRVWVQADTEDETGLRVTYTLRQKLRENFLTSPYLRRYFSEDAAIATYFFFSEAFANAHESITGGAS